MLTCTWRKQTLATLQCVCMPSTTHSRNTTALVCLLAHKAFVKAKHSVLHIRYAMTVSATSLCYRTSEGSTSALGRTESFRIALFGTFSPAYLYLHADVDKTVTDTGNRRRQQTETDLDVTETEVDKAETDTGIDTANHHRKNGASRIILYRYVFNTQAQNRRCACTYAPNCPHAHALCEEVLHPSITSFSQLLHDALKVHFSHEAF
jgi:hypothetical protein